MERSGIFKRRLIHVAKKCGAIAKEADFASVSISGLMEALRGTPVYDEALSVIFHDDFDVAAAESIISQIQRKEIEVVVLETEGAPSPIARIGLEEVSRRGEIVSPERLRAIIRQSTEARIRESFLVAACTNCWEYVELEEGGRRLAGEVSPLREEGHGGLHHRVVRGGLQRNASRRGAGRLMHGKALKVLEILKKSAQIKNEFGDDALFLIAGRGIRLSEVGALLKKRKETGQDLIDCVIEGEREALRRRYFVSERA